MHHDRHGQHVEDVFGAQHANEVLLRRASPEFKAEIVRVIRTSGKSIEQIAKEYDLTESAVRNWDKQARIDEKGEPNGPLTTEERAELTRLRREMKTVTMERDFLRKAAAFFARSEK